MSVTSSLTVAGWSGVPVSGGAGLKPVMLYDERTHLYANAAAPNVWYDESEVTEFARRGLLVRKRLRTPVMAGGVILYATDAFIRPDGRNRLALDPGPLTLHLVASTSLWLTYLPRDHALDVMRRWGSELLADAARQMSQTASGERRREAALRALDAASRAQFCIFPKTDATRRREMFRWMVVATLVLGQPVDAVYGDASIDLSKSEIALLRREVITAFRVTRSPGRPIHAMLPIDRVVPANGRESPRISEEKW